MNNNKKPLSTTMRIWHRYVGYFLAGIMAVYALSGIVLIFRDTDFLKKEKHMEAKLAGGLSAEEVGKGIKMRDLKFDRADKTLKYFKQGTYDTATGEVKYTVKELPLVIKKLTQLHKASTRQPLYFLNIFFAVALLFFVLSSFWMFRPKTAIFKKGMIFTIAGIILTLILLYI